MYFLDYRCKNYLDEVLLPILNMVILLKKISLFPVL